MDRRVFLKQSARWVVRVAAVGVALPALDGCHHEPATEHGAKATPGARPATPGATAGSAPGEAAGPWKPSMLRPAEAVALEAMLERLLPAGDPKGTPGARQAHVLRYLDGQLKDPHLSGYRGLFAVGARYLDLVARKEHHTTFAGLTAAQQDDELRRFQIGRIPIRFPVARFFEAVRVFALEGFLGDPKYGGNAGGVVWSSIDFDPDACGVTKP